MMVRFLRRGVLLAILAFVGLFVGLRVPQAYSALRHKNERIRVLHQQNADLQSQNETHRKFIHDLRYNRTVQEKVVRERWNLQREGETTFMLQQDGAKKP